MSGALRGSEPDDGETAPETEAPGSIKTERDSTVDLDQLAVQRFSLRASSGPDGGAEFTSSGNPVTVGTHESATFVLNDSTVSRFHFEITVSHGRAILRDLGSLNGTNVDGVRVREAYLRSGSVISLGKTQLRFDIGDDRVGVTVSERGEFGLCVGSSIAMRKVFAVLERASASDATVLLEGETGTGKEIVAESIHRESARRDGPFVVVDCGALPRDLLETELMGHEKGAFTGAIAPREGAFEAASGGTVFLDEIGELSPDLQPKLLRALERREVKRVGSNKYFPVDVRIVAATNRNLRGQVNDARFRSDLYYRLAVVEVKLPPLRERMDDVPALVDRIVSNLGATDCAESAVVKSPHFLSEIRRHTWPGNVRELRNYVERCLAMHESAPIIHAEAPPADSLVDASLPLRTARERWTGVLEKRYLEALLAQHANNVTRAARAAGVDRIHFYRLLWRHGLR